MNASIRQFVQNAFGREEAKTVALVSPRRDLLDALRSALKDEKRFQLVTIQGNLSQVQPQLGSGLRPLVLVADMRGDIAASIAGIEMLRKGGFNGAIVVISEPLDEASLRGMLRFHVADWLPADAGTAEIIDACERALSARRPGDGRSRAQCLAFVPAAGGAGTTTLAIQAAYLLASRTHDFNRTCLVDLNLQSGCLADYLDLQPLFDADTIRGEPGRLDERLLEMMLARHATGLAVLASARAPTERARADGKLDDGAERRLRHVSAHGARLPAGVAGLDLRCPCRLRPDLRRHRVHGAGHAPGPRGDRCHRRPLRQGAQRGRDRQQAAAALVRRRSAQA
jgi:pilus assembly protein CpaE